MFEHIRPLDLRSEQRKRRWIFSAIYILLVACFLYFEFRTLPQEWQVDNFLSAIQRQDFQNAYEIWKPASSYTFKNFMEDWGPDGFIGQVNSFEIGNSRSQGSGVLVFIVLNGNKPLLLWAEKSDKSLSFSPFEEPESGLLRVFPASVANLWLVRGQRRAILGISLVLILAGFLLFDSRKNRSLEDQQIA